MFMIITRTYTHYFRIKKFLPLFCELYSKKSPYLLQRELKELTKNKNYKLLVTFYDKKPVAIASITEGFVIYCGKYLQISNLYVKKEHRNLGIAKELLNETKRLAKNKNCKHIMLDSYVTNKASHKTYFREEFEIKAYHFMKEIS